MGVIGLIGKLYVPDLPMLRETWRRWGWKRCTHLFSLTSWSYWRVILQVYHTVIPNAIPTEISRLLGILGITAGISMSLDYRYSFQMCLAASVVIALHDSSFRACAFCE